MNDKKTKEVGGRESVSMLPGVTVGVMIAVIAFVLSFDALRLVFVSSGINPLLSWGGPLCVDGTILLCTWATWGFRKGHIRGRWYPWAGLVLFSLFSVTGNALHAWLNAGGMLPTWGAPAIMSIPPIALLYSTHLIVIIAGDRQDKLARTTGKAACAAAAAGCCGYPCGQAWMDLADLRAQIHDGCCVAVQVERRVRGQRDPVRVWMGLRGFDHDEARMVDLVQLNDPAADSDGSVGTTMALVDFMRYFTGRAIALRAKPRDIAANRPRRLRCELVPGKEEGVYFFEQHGEADPLPEDFSGWTAYALHDGVAHATTAHRNFHCMERTRDGGIRFPAAQMAEGGRCSVYAVDQTGTMRVAEVRLPKPKPAPETARPASQAQAKPEK